ncbi:MAG: lytic transglycosylase domain-containing protein [Bacteroidales bacterium]|nr:lytic transglycosylase domain-containing protein [Bacteroidales bacterium]
MSNIPGKNKSFIALQAFITGLTLVLILVSVFIIQGFNNSETGQTEEPEHYTVSAVKIPDRIEFAGEEVPLDNFDTRESLDRELLVNTYFHSQTFLLIKKSTRFFPIIEPILKKNGIPDDFKYLSVIESNLDNSVSPRQAVGFWQLLEGTAKDYGLEVNKEVDERYHLEKSTDAACKYLLDSYIKYNNWTMTAASYNAGRNGMDRQLERQNGNNYYDLLLNEETARYIFRILSIKMIISDPEKYGFHLEKENYYPEIPTYEVKVDTAISDFNRFADNYGINYKMLKYFNPWLRETYLTNKSGKTYIIKIPEPGSRSYRSLLNQTSREQE